MDKITRFTSRTVVLPQSDIDTDQIVPARFLTTTTRKGLGQALFADWRYDSAGQPRPDFALNQPAAGSSSPGTTSAAVPRASTRPGPCSITASERSSAPASPTSSATTR